MVDSVKVAGFGVEAFGDYHNIKVADFGVEAFGDYHNIKTTSFGVEVFGNYHNVKTTNFGVEVFGSFPIISAVCSGGATASGESSTDIFADSYCANPLYNKNRPYQSLMDILLEPVNEAIDNPTGNWADFNCLYNTYEKIKDIADHGNGRAFFCPEDVPAEPQVDEYPDLEEPKTVDCDQNL